MIEANKESMSVASGWFKAEIDRKTLKKLAKRSDYEAWKHMIIFFFSLMILGIACFLSWGTWWFIPAYLAYCTLHAGGDPIWHECGHRTAFKTRKLNDFFYLIGSYMNSFEPVRWRWSHSLHHSYTASLDPHDYETEEMIYQEKTLFSYFTGFIPGILFLRIHKSIFVEIIKHALGIRTKVMIDCIPKDKIQNCINSSRVFVLIWITIIILSIYLQSLLPVLLFLVPRFFANFANLWGMTQHTGLRGNVKDHRVTTRSIRLNPIFSFIYWKMEYHVEHHMFPMIPSYNLPKLYEVIKDQLPKPKTILSAHKDIIKGIIKKKTDPNYYIKVELPTN
tara:strand:+ start:1227 stop:2231 length:1005 start_codon:yes stop_codon:yes gene_type:complete